MVKDLVAEKTNNKQIIEALIGDGNINVWIPVMATNIYMIGNDGELSKVKELHVRKLKKD